MPISDRDAVIELTNRVFDLTDAKDWPGVRASAARPYDAADHALAPFRPEVAAAAAQLAPLVTEKLLAEVTAEIPDEWLADEPGFDSPDALRLAYAEPLLARAAVIHERIQGIEGIE